MKVLGARCNVPHRASADTRVGREASYAAREHGASLQTTLFGKMSQGAKNCRRKTSLSDPCKGLKLLSCGPSMTTAELTNTDLQSDHVNGFERGLGTDR